MEAWGEALVAQKNYKEAIAKFTAAADYAPRWGALYVRWGETLDDVGDRTRARSQYLKASHLALSADDEREVARRLGMSQP